MLWMNSPNVLVQVANTPRFQVTNGTDIGLLACVYHVVVPEVPLVVELFGANWAAIFHTRRHLVGDLRVLELVEGHHRLVGGAEERRRGPDHFPNARRKLQERLRRHVIEWHTGPTTLETRARENQNHLVHNTMAEERTYLVPLDSLLKFYRGNEMLAGSGEDGCKGWGRHDEEFQTLLSSLTTLAQYLIGSKGGEDEYQQPTQISQKNNHGFTTHI